MAGSTSVQDMVRPSECVDLYYYDGATNMKQCFPTTQNTKYQQAFNTLGAGQNVFTIPPQNGIQDIIVTASITVPATVNCNLISGWLYALIDQVSFRYGGSSQFFLTGDQILQNAIRKQPSRTTADDIFNLGGNAVTSTGAAQTVYASVVLTLPHNSCPSGVGKNHPLPTDALTQQTQVTLILKSPQSVFWGAAVASAPTLLASANFAVQQVMLNNQGDALARRVNMADNAYAFPCEFVQQKQTLALSGTFGGAGSTPAQVVLTGFRSGEVKSIHCWLTKASDTSTPATANDPFRWYQPLSIQMLYAGDKYAVYTNQSAQLWNVLNGNKIPAFDNFLSSTGATYLSYWTELPFAQTFVDEDSHYMLVHGKAITNGIVNLEIVPPTSAADWVLNVSYNYNSTLLFSQGTCDYVF